MRKFHITIVRPPGYRHSSCFIEVAEGLFHGLRALGHPVTLRENHIEPGATTVLFGAHLLERRHALALPPWVVVYNLEQLGSYTVPAWYLELAARVPVWDYAPRNLLRWQSASCRVPPRLVEIGYVPELTRIASAPEQDIDVLFYGAVTDRRRRVLDAVEAAGLRVHTAFGVYGPERDALIARAKVVLNLHAEETMRVFEAVRVSYLLANRKAVVSEMSEDFGRLQEAVAVCPLEAVVETCLRLVRDERARQALEERGSRLFAERKMVDVLAALSLSG